MQVTHKVNRVLLGLELHGRTLHVIGTAGQYHPRRSIDDLRASPSHQGVLPSTGSLQYIPVNLPVVVAGSARLHGRLGRLEDAHGTEV